jgi:glucose dehydrogenase
MAADAGTSTSGGGCSIGGSADRDLTGVWLLVAALVLLRRRRLQRKSA